MLSNSQIGVYFNDNTKIIQDSDKNFLYYERHGTSKEDTEHRFKLENIPSYAKKKVLIHEQFTRYILGDKDDNSVD
jgi:POLO box duplicated region